MDNKLPTLNAALVKIIGIFSYNEGNKLQFNQMGYQTLPIDTVLVAGKNKIKDNEKFVKDTYYAEFANLFFPNNKNQYSTPIYLNKEFDFIFEKKEKGEIIPIEARVVDPELYFFSNNTGIFSLTFKILKKDFKYLSDITFCASSFDNIIAEKDIKMDFHEWISKNILAGIKLRGENIETDKYSGSKFKVYTIIDAKCCKIRIFR
jgi:hypothetical protein